MAKAIHLNLDNAWPADALPLETLDATSWGPRLRFSAPAGLIEEFYRDYETRVAPFLVYGSGDFHHLSALWARRLDDPFVLVSFDNHPDWDIRPPRWGCGGWVNRALELPHVKKVSVWGCGNFECWWPRQLFGNRRAEREGRLEVHPWADGRPVSDQDRRGAILRANWREHFARFVAELGGVERVCHDRSRLPARRRRGHELGERAVHAGRCGLGAGAFARFEGADRGGRYLRRIFPAHLRASEAAFRRGNGSSEISTT